MSQSEDYLIKPSSGDISMIKSFYKFVKFENAGGDPLVPVQSISSAEERSEFELSSGGKIIYIPEDDDYSAMMMVLVAAGKNNGVYIEDMKEAFVHAVSHGWGGIHIIDGDQQCHRLIWMLC